MRSIALAAIGLTMASVPLVSERAAPKASTQPPRTPTQGRATALRPAAPRVESPVPFRVGEALTYDVSWSSFLVAGTVVMSVKEKKPSFSSTAYYVVAECRPVSLVSRLYSLYYKLDSLVDVYGLLSQRGSLYSEEGSRHRYIATRFDRAASHAVFERGNDATVAGDIPVPPGAQDGLAAFYSLRGRTFKTGEHLTIPIADSGTLFTAVVDVAAPEAVKVPIGRVDAWKLNLAILDGAGKAVRKDIAIWLSNDARRVPVKVQADLAVGSFVLALRDAQ